ncbi:hypothetical protein B0H14DRAFT_3589835 [Mycena olivaceomarginata]|nr:hypothetical protein B0H14DRAFT_3589835 [Mycena olivaceomarginata]
MTPKKWVEAAMEYNSHFKTLQVPTGTKEVFVASNPRALMDRLGDTEIKISQRLAVKNFTSQSGETKFWTEHCFVVPFIKTETGDYFPQLGYLRIVPFLPKGSTNVPWITAEGGIPRLPG